MNGIHGAVTEDCSPDWNEEVASAIARADAVAGGSGEVRPSPKEGLGGCVVTCGGGGGWAVAWGGGGNREMKRSRLPARAWLPSGGELLSLEEMTAASREASPGGGVVAGA